MEDLIENVLILILLEDGFWLLHESLTLELPFVLILILLEDGFWLFISQKHKQRISQVLILILLEDGFW